MTATEILKLSEAVDHSDSAKLDEIDARVWCYLRRYTYRPHGKVDTYNFTYEIPPMRALHIKSINDNDAGRYTRSRDALKDIRKGGWAYFMNTVHTDHGLIIGYHCVIAFASDEVFESPYDASTPALKTEELAELHAIIQSLEFERKNEK